MENETRNVPLNGSDIVYSLPTATFLAPVAASVPIKVEIANMGQQKHRGRKRTLDHLSQEEKLLRKKLKNREAAQTSRDKKKAKLEDLEREVTYLRQCNQTLSLELERVKMEKADAQLENEKLREVLRLSDCTQGRTLEQSLGSAVSVVKSPLPQGCSGLPILQQTLRMWMLYLQIYCLMNGTGCLTFGVLVSQILPVWTNLFEICQKCHKRKSRYHARKWWGRQQSCWNPMERLMATAA